MKARRQSAIVDIIHRSPVRNQEQLRRSMRAAGFDVTQATLSRDIRDLGLVKGGADGAYQAPPLPHRAPQNGQSLLHRAASDYLTRVDQVQQMVVLRTGPGQAQLLGVAIDAAQLPEVVGTIAGDDTILVIARDPRRARALVKRLEHL
ncbi:MAG TPA: arginine repressor [Vicinamibacterales bacterium]|nr:arginine repressor [Vicinamibacterales bacterium]HVG54649.1 arginine repressor [Vicinamibacterales bacterium]